MTSANNSPAATGIGEGLHGVRHRISACKTWPISNRGRGRRCCGLLKATLIFFAGITRPGRFPNPFVNQGERDIFAALRRHAVPFVIIGGHAVNFHGYTRATEDADVVWLRSAAAEQALLAALSEIGAQYIGADIDPSTGIERTYPVTLPFIKSSRLMMLVTRAGFLDLFDYIPGLPGEDVEQVMQSSVEDDGLRYASLEWMRRMKQAAGRPRDRLDLENLPE
jgi:hypothetical protein